MNNGLQHVETWYHKIWVALGVGVGGGKVGGGCRYVAGIDRIMGSSRKRTGILRSGSHWCGCGWVLVWRRCVYVCGGGGKHGFQRV